MQLKKTYWLQLAAVMMLMMQAAGLHAHISIDANDTSIQSHLQAAESHADSHASDSESSDDASNHLTQATSAKYQSSMGWVLPVFLACVLLDDPASSVKPDFPDGQETPHPAAYYQRPPTRGPPAIA